MRNYVTLFVWQLDIYDNTPVFVESVYAIRAESRSLQSVQNAVQANLAPGWTIQKTDLGQKYFLASRGYISSYLTLGGPFALVASSFIYNSFQSGIVLDGSPKRNPAWGYKSDVKPGTTFTGKNVAGKQTMSLETYLIYLLANWQAGVRVLQGDRVTVVNAPKRWVDWLTRLILDLENQRVSSTQVYAWLAQVDFPAVPPKIP